jgi:hypothetical protein
VGGDVDIEEHLRHRRIIEADLAVAAGLVHEAVLQPVERRLAGQRRHNRLALIDLLGPRPQRVG